MLELPELELYRALLAERCAGQRITAFTIRNRAFKKYGNLDQELTGAGIWFVERRYGIIVFHLDNGKRLTLEFEETGFPYFCTSEEAAKRKCDIELAIGDKALCLSGVVKESLRLLSVKQLEESLKGLAPDPLDKRFTLAKWIENWGKKRGYVKSALMDPKLLPGIGAVYSDEIAFEAGIAPDVKVSSLHSEQLSALYKAVGDVIRQSIAAGGVAGNELFPGDGLTGGYVEKLQVHSREGMPCPRCEETVVKAVIATRKSHYCPGCQKGAE